MSAWRRKALELLPQHRTLIEAAESPMALWIELHLRFCDHVRSGDRAAERAVLEYASWCAHEGAGTGPSDTLTAVICAFYENIGGEKELWPRFKEWFQPREFEGLATAFRYFLTGAEFQHLRETFYAGPRRSTKRR